MSLQFLGPDPRVPGDLGLLEPQLATIFPPSGILVTLPGIHVSQRVAYIDSVRQARGESNQPPLTPEQQEAIWASAVDLFIRRDRIEIRPDPEQMDLAFQAGELLQEIIPKHRVRFLSGGNTRVHDAMQRAGELWRITPSPISTRDAIQLIQDCRLGIGGRKIYYHSPVTGTRLVTCQEFANLAQLSDKELKDHLVEIQYYSSCFNRFGNPEVDFFIAGRKFRDHLVQTDFTVLNATSLRDSHAALSQQFTVAVPPELRRDDPTQVEWRQRILTELQPIEQDHVLEEKLLGLATEFHRLIQWLPGGRIERGELVFDSFFDEATPSGDEEGDLLLDEKVRGLIHNFMRDYADLEYINIGRMTSSLSLVRRKRGRREVYVVEMKRHAAQHEIVKIIRVQNWDVREHLDCGKSLLEAIVDSEDYTDYVLDQRMGCLRLSMNLPVALTTGRIQEIYRGKQTGLHGTRIRTPYFVRDYVAGIATDKLPLERFQRDGYAIRFAELLGGAAAPNMIVGRCGEDGHVLFDDGDEVIVEDERGLPYQLVVIHHTGAFTDYKSDLANCAEEYAKPIKDRVTQVPDPAAFLESYLSSFVCRFLEIQEEYRDHRKAFDGLFRHLHYDPAGSFAYRWECVLKRLDTTDVREIVHQLRVHLTDLS